MENLPVHYLDSPANLGDLIAEVAGETAVGLDTEFISEGRYEPALCLVQIATTKAVWIVDPLTLTDLGELWAVLVERELVTVAARQEIRFCLKGSGREPAHVFDLQLAAGLLGYGFPLSHTNLVLRLLNQKVHGGESFTDWRRRPLTQTQLKYAGDDVGYLLEMRRRLLRRAEQMQRVAWIEDECRRLVGDVVAEQEKWRVAGSARLNRRQLGVLLHVWRWRDRLAQKTNVPASRVLSDSMLVEVARRSPSTAEDLFAIRGLDRRLLRGAEHEIVKAVKVAQAVPEAELPSTERREDPPQVAVLAKLLAVAANGLAAEHEVDPALLATATDLQELVRWYLREHGAARGDGRENARPALLEGWRSEIVSGPLLGFLSGERCVRVGNVKRANPLVFERYKADGAKERSSAPAGQKLPASESGAAAPVNAGVLAGDSKSGS